MAKRTRMVEFASEAEAKNLPTIAINAEVLAKMKEFARAMEPVKARMAVLSASISKAVSR